MTARRLRNEVRLPAEDGKKKRGFELAHAQTLAYKAVRSVFEPKTAQLVLRRGATVGLSNTGRVPQPLKGLSAGRGSYLTNAVIQKYSNQLEGVLQTCWLVLCSVLRRVGTSENVEVKSV